MSFWCFFRRWLALESLSAQQEVYNVLLRSILMRNTLSYIYDELVWFVKHYFNTFIFRKNKYLQTINFGNDQSNSDEVSMELIDNSRMKLVSTWRYTEEMYECWFMFCYAVWPSSYNKRLTQTYKTVIKLTKDTDLPTSWKCAVQNDTYPKLWESLFNASTSWAKHKMKALWPLVQVKAAYAVLYFAYACINWLPQISQKHFESDCHVWDLEMSLTFLLVLIGNWSDIFGHWWKSNEFIDWDWLSSTTGFGTQSVFVGLWLIFGVQNRTKYINNKSFLQTIIPSEYWGVMSRLEKINVPSCFDWPEINNIIWNPNRNTKHHCFKFSQLTSLLGTILYYFHYDIIERHMNCIQFKRNATFGSSLMNGKCNNSATSIAFVFESMKMQTVWLSKLEKEQIGATFLALSSVKMDCMKMPKIPGITKYSLQYIIDSTFCVSVYKSKIYEFTDFGNVLLS